MWLVRIALRRPITVLVAVLAVALCSYLAVHRMKADIFPELGDPTIYVAQPYSGMDPAQMEGYMTYYYEYHFLYITGIEHVESKNIQGAALMKLAFYPGTDMDQAMAQVVGYVNRARAFMPPGVVGPFITRFDVGSVPVGQLVFSSENHTQGELQDFALNSVRPLFATLPGVSAPPPFGGNQRTIVVRLDPQKLRDYRVSPEEAIRAVAQSSSVQPSGNIRTGDLLRIASTNAAIGANLQELMEAPVRTGSGPAVYLHDLGVIENGTDIITSYAHVNGKRAVYIMVTKRSDASTLDVIQSVKESLPKFRAVVPGDVKITLEFDQSHYVTSAIRSLVNEGLLGAVLTGLMVLIFLRDWRSALIVITTIPVALLSSVILLWITGQTINLMTLGGLALAVGVLVDEATVEVENIHAHISTGLSRARSVVQACEKTAVARFLSMLCILSVFVPSFFMVGIGRQLFVPLSLAVGFAMVSSYILSTTLVPVLATWLMREESHSGREFFERIRQGYGSYLDFVLKLRLPIVLLYLAASALFLYLAVPKLGTEIFPTTAASQFQIRMRAPTGTRVEKTERMALQALDLIKREAGTDNVAISTAFIGVQPASYPINTIYLWTGGPEEIVMTVAMKNAASGSNFEERLRARFAKEMPAMRISFEASDIISRVMSFGSPTPIEVAVQSPSLANAKAHAEKVRIELEKEGYLRDLQYAQSFDYPTLEVKIDRDRAGQYGLTAENVARSLVAATSSSRFIQPNYWRDPISGNAFQIQVEIPQNQMQSTSDLENLPVMATGDSRPMLAEIASLKYGLTNGEIDRYNMQRVASFTANISGLPLGSAAPLVRNAIARAGEPPRGVTVNLRGQIPALQQTLSGLQTGLLLAVAVIFLLLAANFQSLRLGLAVVSTVPAVICGVVLMLVLTGTTLNVQSFTGAIMAIGIAVANAILLVTFAERLRRSGQTALDASAEAGRERLRAILMTAVAMIAGMLPMALALGESGEQSAPLGRAVIGGLALATLATITILPAVYAMAQRKAPAFSPSLDPDDSGGKYYDGK
jgi:multidrug efflux pump subunit AcrB